MKFLNKYNYISFVLLFLVIVAQFVPLQTLQNFTLK